MHEVRTALTHLFDFAYLQNHPLALRLSATQPMDGMTRARRLRRLLLDCIEALRPESKMPSTIARAYAILTYRCVDGLEMEEIEAKLALSRRQTYRDYSRGVEAVASQLWDVLERHASELGITEKTQPAMPSNPRMVLAELEVERLRKEVSLEPVDLDDLLAGVCQLLALRSQQRGITLQVTEMTTVAPVLADRTLLRQALINLLSYALDTLPSQSTLRIESISSERALTLFFGIAESTQPAPHSAPAVPRQGVGLTVAQILLTAQGGTLLVEQKNGRWQASMTLPLAQLSSAPTVLVVDDNADLIALFQRYLAGHRVTVVGATNGPQAQALALKLHPQLIVLDVMLPQQDGWEILQGLRGHPPLTSVPIIMCSVLNERTLALSLGASDYITKPVTQAVLLTTLQQWLGRLNTVG